MEKVTVIVQMDIDKALDIELKKALVEQIQQLRKVSKEPDDLEEILEVSDAIDCLSYNYLQISSS